MRVLHAAPIPKTPREEILHIYLVALLARLGGTVELTVEEIEKTRYGRIKQKREGTITLTLEA